MQTYKTPHWTFYSANNELIYSDGKSIQLAARHNACLLALLEAKGEAVDYDTMLLKVWGTQFRDTNTIASVISELRKQINCGDPSLKYIVTIPKKGYRFNNFEEVEILQESISHPQKIQNENNLALQIKASTTPKLKKPLNTIFSLKNTTLPILGSLLISAFFITDVYSFLSSKKLSLSALSYEKGIEYDFEVSRDKQTLIYTNEQKENSYLISKNITTGEKQVIKLEPGLVISSFALSMDGNQLAFIEQKDDSSCLYIARVSDSKIQLQDKKLITTCDKNSFLFSLEFSHSADAIFYAKGKNISDPYTISKHDLTTGLERNLTSPPTTGRGDYAPTLSPDGRKVAFVRDIFWERSSIWTLDLVSGETLKLFEFPNVIDKISWHNDEMIIFTHSNKLLSYSTVDDEIENIYEAESPLYMPNSVEGTIYLSAGSLFSSYLSKIKLDTLDVVKKEQSDYLEHTPTRILDDQSYYFLSNRSHKMGIWKSQGSSSQLIIDSDDLKDVTTLRDAGDMLLTTTPSKLIQIDKTTGSISVLKSDIPNIENYSYSEQSGKILYSKEVGESWYLESYNLKTQNKELLGVSGYTGHFFDDMIYLTEFRESGLWQYNPNTREKQLLIADFNSFFTDKWAVTQEYIFLLDKESLKVWNRQEDYKLVKNIQLTDAPKRISCGDNECIFDQYALGSTGIVSLVESD